MKGSGKTRAASRGSRKVAQALSILVISGPNLDRLGTREPAIYGTATLADISRDLAVRGDALGAAVTSVQTNHEGDIVDMIGSAKDDGHHGLILNAGGYTHTSVAILDAILGSGLPCVEVHLSNPEARETFRHMSVIARACVGKIAGFGGLSYVLALEALVARLRA